MFISLVTSSPKCSEGHTTSIIGLVVEFVVAIDEARVRFTDDAQHFFFVFYLQNPFFFFA